MTKWISYRALRTGDGAAYHTSAECHHVRENHFTVPDDHTRLTNMTECEHCATGAKGSPDPEQECPYCGAVVGQLPMHLPCEATP